MLTGCWLKVGFGMLVPPRVCCVVCVACCVFAHVCFGHAYCLHARLVLFTHAFCCDVVVLVCARRSLVRRLRLLSAFFPAFLVTCLSVCAFFSLSFLVCFCPCLLLVFGYVPLAFTGRLGVQTAGGHLLDSLVNMDAWRIYCKICMLACLMIEVSVIGCACFSFFLDVLVFVACLFPSLLLCLALPFLFPLSLFFSLSASAYSK